MDFEDQFSQLASLLGDKSRAVMLWNLLDGRAYTATELAICANISLQSASNHLSKLVNGKIVTVDKQGRHRYYRFANAEVAQVIESMASLLAVSPALHRKERPHPAGITYARTCYDHLAGKLSVDITDSFIQQGIIKPIEKNYEVNSFGNDWLKSVGIIVEETKLQKRSFAHSCLDWSERRHHLAGALGASLLQMMLKNDWIRRIQYSREILITPKGKMELKNRLNLQV